MVSFGVWSSVSALRLALESTCGGEELHVKAAIWSPFFHLHLLGPLFVSSLVVLPADLPQFVIGNTSTSLSHFCRASWVVFLSSKTAGRVKEVSTTRSLRRGF